MGKINVGKVIIGGIVAGIVMNVIDFVINMYVMKAQLDAEAIAHNVDPNAANPATFIALDFAMALLLVFTYAAIRTRFGPGPKTAVVAGLIIALTACTLAAYFAAQGMFTWDLWAKMSGLSTLSIVAAGLAGGAVYKE